MFRFSGMSSELPDLGLSDFDMDGPDLDDGVEADTDSSSLKPRTRFWPAASGMALSIVFLVVGPIGVIGSAMSEEWIAVGIFAVLFIYGVCTLGWVDVTEEAIVSKRLFGGGPVPFTDIREIRLGNQRSKSTKWWYPEVETNSGDFIKLTTLKTMSGTRAEQRVKTLIAAAGKNARVLREANPEAFGMTEESLPKPEKEYSMTPGYDEYLREKAAEEAAALARGEVLQPAFVPAPMPLPEPEPEPEPIAEVEEPLAPEEPAPFVFTPRPASEHPSEPEVFTPQPVVVQPPPVPVPAQAPVHPGPTPFVHVAEHQISADPQPAPAPVAQQQPQPMMTPPPIPQTQQQLLAQQQAAQVQAQQQQLLAQQQAAQAQAQQQQLLLAQQQAAQFNQAA